MQAMAGAVTALLAQRAALPGTPQPRLALPAPA